MWQCLLFMKKHLALRLINTIKLSLRCQILLPCRREQVVLKNIPKKKQDLGRFVYVLQHPGLCCVKSCYYGDDAASSC